MIRVGDLVEVSTYQGGECRLILCIARLSKSFAPLYITSQHFQRVTGLQSVISYSAGTVCWSVG